MAGPKKKDEVWVCPYHVEYEGREPMIVAHCLECSYGKHDLTLKRCLEGMLNAYSREFNVHKIQLKHYVETQYYGLSIELISQLAKFAQELELSIKDPVAFYFKAGEVSEGQRRKYPCHTCPANPYNLFSDLHHRFVSNLPEFYKGLKHAVKTVNGQRGRARPQCKECIRTTIDDLNYIMDLWLEMSEQIIRSGYGVLLKEKK